MVLGIITIVTDIVEQGFQDSQIIVIDGSPDQTRFLYNALRSLYNTDIQVIRSVGVDQTARPSISGATISAKWPPSHVGQHTGKEKVYDEVVEEPKEEIDDEAEEALKDDNSESDHDSNGNEPSGESLQS